MLKTKRLILREIKMEDAQFLFEMDTMPEVQRYTGDVIPDNIEFVKNRISQISQKDYSTYGFGRLLVINKTTDEKIGWCGLKYLPEHDIVDLGYRFKPEYWGMGYGTETSLEIIKHGFEVLKLEKIAGIAELENVASTNIMKKVGMQFDRMAPYDFNDTENVAWYSITKEKYLAQK